MTDRRFVIGSPGHVIIPLQKRVMTKQVAVIANEAKQSREPDSVRNNDFVIIRPRRLHQTGENDKRKMSFVPQAKQTH